MSNYISRIGCISIKVGRAPMELLEAFTIPEEDREETLRELKWEFDLEGLIYVATCNRVEFFMMIPAEMELTHIRNALLDNFLERRPEKLKARLEPDCFRLYTGRRAVRHIFHVASSLDSIVVGEAQVLGQMKEAHRFALSAGFSDQVLNRIMSAAFKSAKMIRTETELGKKPVSMASLVIQKLDKILDEDPQRSIAIVGSGPMTGKLARIIRKRHNNTLLFVNRTPEKVQRTAEQFQGRVVPLSDFLEGEIKADIVISSTSSNEPIFTSDNIEKIIPESGNLKAFDMAIPRDFERVLTDADNIRIWDLDRLSELSRKNRRDRFRTADKADRIIDQQVTEYMKKEIANMISPFFHATLSEIMDMADDGLESLFEKKLGHLSGEDKKLLKYWSQKLVNRACFAPARLLAEQIVEADMEDKLELTDLFDKDDQAAAS